VLDAARGAEEIAADIRARVAPLLAALDAVVPDAAVPDTVGRTP
jgi:hypothetical protein